MKKFILGMMVALLFISKAGLFRLSLAVPREPAPVNNQLIRLHVIANSDSPADQALKYRVRDAVIAEMEPVFARASGIDEVRQLLGENLPRIESLAASTVARAGEKYPVYTYFGYFDFPTKSYGQFTLPAGRYEAVRIVIGQGQGANWWCVLFPPLCFVNISNGIAENRERGVNPEPGVAKLPPQIRFKSLEWLQVQRGQLAKLINW
ncbi:MAG: stage II sporulation protein R [Firmicutes bacterium]|nr:stage II sporulation protein R [Bacillota bacterium]